jgi:hypothetical protein
LFYFQNHVARFRNQIPLVRAARKHFWLGWVVLFVFQIGCVKNPPGASDQGSTNGNAQGSDKITWGVTICGPGKENIDGHCCWPGQSWQDDECVGTPRCPVDFKLSGGDCEPDCRHLQIITGGRCCWRGQQWPEEQDACEGKPDCPEGTEVEGADCVPDMDVGQSGTDLVWLRCPVGQTWTGNVCEGHRTEMSWDDAQKTCPPGYRLPTIREFAALLGGCGAEVKKGKTGKCTSCRDSTSCAELFRADMDCYWAAEAHNAEYAWNALFELGRIGTNRKVSPAAVRCVKGGE